VSSRRRRSGSLSRDRRWALRWSYLFLTVFAIFFLMPPVYMLITSLKTSAEISAATNPWWVYHPTLGNYLELLGSRQYLTFFRNSALVSVIVVAITMLISVPAAFALSRMRFWGSVALATGVFLTYLIPATIFAFSVSLARLLDARGVAPAADQLGLPVGILAALNEVDVYNWGQIMTGVLLGAAPPLVIYALHMDYCSAGLTARAATG